MRKYVNLGYGPKNIESSLSNGICGVCHDKDSWYVSQGASIKKVPAYDLDKNLPCRTQDRGEYFPVYMSGRLQSVHYCKYYLSNSKTPVGIKVDGVNFGDIDYCNGYLFAPVYDSGKIDTQILVFSASTFDCVGRQILYKKDGVPFQKMEWCAINPQDNCLYTSDAYVSASFEGPNSPLMAFKINFGCLNCLNMNIFSCVNKDGIRLERKVKLNSNERTPYFLDAEVRGGCFDPFDTLYLSTNSYQDDYIRNKAYFLWIDKGRPMQSDWDKRMDWVNATKKIDADAAVGVRERDGITAFQLERKNSTSDVEYIKRTAYYIWVSKGRPFQSNENRDNDWIDAIGQISAAMQSGMAKSDGAAYAAVAYVKAGVSKYTDDSIIDFPFKEDKMEEPKGITYWDLRRYSQNGDVGTAWYDGCLHAIKLKKNSTNLGLNSFSLQNFVLKNLETSSVVLNYNPNNLAMRLNQATGRYLVVDGSIPIKEFADIIEARTALSVLKKFTSIYLMGRCASNEVEYDLCYDFLYNPNPNASKLSSVECESVRFDNFRVESGLNVFENRWMSDCAIVMDLQNYKDFNEPYQKIVLPVHNPGLGRIIDEIISKSSFTKEKGGRLNYIKSASNRPHDTLYWFD